MFLPWRVSGGYIPHCHWKVLFRGRSATGEISWSGLHGSWRLCYTADHPEILTGSRFAASTTGDCMPPLRGGVNGTWTSTTEARTPLKASMKVSCQLRWRVTLHYMRSFPFGMFPPPPLPSPGLPLALAVPPRPAPAPTRRRRQPQCGVEGVGVELEPVAAPVEPAAAASSRLDPMWKRSFWYDIISLWVAVGPKYEETHKGFSTFFEQSWTREAKITAHLALLSLNDPLIRPALSGRWHWRGGPWNVHDKWLSWGLNLTWDFSCCISRMSMVVSKFGSNWLHTF